jgi:hypothetical protein
MSQETWEIVTNKEIDGIEMQLALQCAPLIIADTVYSVEHGRVNRLKLSEASGFK